MRTITKPIQPVTLVLGSHAASSRNSHSIRAHCRDRYGTEIVFMPCHSFEEEADCGASALSTEQSAMEQQATETVLPLPYSRNHLPPERCGQKTTMEGTQPNVLCGSRV